MKAELRTKKLGWKGLDVLILKLNCRYISGSSLAYIDLVVLVLFGILCDPKDKTCSCSYVYTTWNCYWPKDAANGHISKEDSLQLKEEN